MIPKSILDRIEWKKSKPDWQEPLKIKNIKPVLSDCEHCGRPVLDKTERIRLLSFPKPHWRTTCNACGLSRHPETGEYSLTDSEYVDLLKRKHK